MPQHPQPLRLWPGVFAAALLLLLRLGLPVVWPEQTIIGVLSGVAGGAIILLWWMFFSRAPWAERLGAVVLMVVGLAVTWPLVDVSISTGAMGALLPMLAIPPMSVALVVCAVASRGLTDASRRATMVATILLACGVWTLAKTGGFTSEFDNDLMWRWAKTPEERLVGNEAAALPLAHPVVAAPREVTAVVPLTPSSAPVSETAPLVNVARTPEWDGFRGPRRDGVVRGVRIETDWAKHPPSPLWRRPIGPGWSSFAVQGDLLYTQEQRGDEEIVSSYNINTGRPVWSHRDTVRFWESNGGAGPRATPTLSNGRVYTFGATGVLNVLDASSGALMWSHTVATDTNTKVPTWGFSGSPLVVDALNLVVVAASGTLAAYDLASGTLQWVGPHHDANESYSSPQRLTIDGVDQIVLSSGDGATGVAPAGGKVLWEHALPGSPILQPVLTSDGDLLIHKSGRDGTTGIVRLHVANGPDGWKVTERWTSEALKTMFNDFVIHKGYAFGFDGSILACVDLADGKRKWKGGRYGSGQLVLLRDQDVLLVVSEEGELALVSATTDKFTELARLPAIEGKTWNHPVLVRDVMLVRNGEEMAAFRVSVQRP